jgi:GT2 family glycosyltransferase
MILARVPKERSAQEILQPMVALAYFFARKSLFTVPGTIINKAAVIIASVGRPELVQSLLVELSLQSHLPSQVIVSVPTVADLPPSNTGTSLYVTAVVGSRGASAQRNAAMAKLDVGTDAVFFFDDDAIPRDDYIETALSHFSTHPEVVGLTGSVVVDGAGRNEISRADAVTALERSRARLTSGLVTPVGALYGCNFAIRHSAFEYRFDERLPLYSWLEDLDFSRRIMAVGTLVTVADCVAAHLGSASGGRLQHVRFGYSQITNPIYLQIKGSITLRDTLRLVCKPLLRNLLDSVAGRDKSWRRQRLKGNWMSGVDLIAGRVTPERISDIQS